MSYSYQINVETESRISDYEGHGLIHTTKVLNISLCFTIFWKIIILNKIEETQIKVKP